VAKDKHGRKTTPTEAFAPSGVDVRDAVIAEMSAGIDVGDTTSLAQGAETSLPPRGDGPVPDRSVADRLRERVEREG
jgi:hypothetical protein